MRLHEPSKVVNSHLDLDVNKYYMLYFFPYKDSGTPKFKIDLDA